MNNTKIEKEPIYYYEDRLGTDNYTLFNNGNANNIKKYWKDTHKIVFTDNETKGLCSIFDSVVIVACHKEHNSEALDIQKTLDVLSAIILINKKTK